MKVLPKSYITPAAVNIYGDKTATIVWTEKPIAFVVKSKEYSDSFRSYFNLLWKIAKLAAVRLAVINAISVGRNQENTTRGMNAAETTVCPNAPVVTKRKTNALAKDNSEGDYFLKVYL